jgi:hypothetical protein
VWECFIHSKNLLRCLHTQHYFRPSLFEKGTKSCKVLQTVIDMMGKNEILRIPLIYLPQYFTAIFIALSPTKLIFAT